MCDYYAHGYPVGFCDIKRTFDKVLNISGVKRVAAGDFYALTLDENGSLWASGVNPYGQLGFGDTEPRYGFAKVPLPLLVICPEGQYLDEITNTCKLLATSIYFVNGVHNTEDDATSSKDELERTHGERLSKEYEQELFEFKLSYNYHYGDVADLQEMFWQKFKEKEYDEDFYANYFVAWLRALYVAFVSDDALWLIAQEVIDAFSAQPNILIAEQDNLNEMIGAYLDDIAEHKRLLLVAHSQGNLYANQSIRFLRDTFGEEGSKYIKMIGVASPAAVTSDPYITACDDVIINSLRLSPYYSVLACNINNKPQGEDFRNFISHSFVDDYLDMRLPSGEAIKSLIDNIVGQWDHPATQ
jgi:hypothetical protein